MHPLTSVSQGFASDIDSGEQFKKQPRCPTPKYPVSAIICDALARVVIVPIVRTLLVTVFEVSLPIVLPELAAESMFSLH